ncbi:10724_t:CDS:10 [Acaulospora colombiana]|uniref:10724_t:CDS:1 n=1 Tax=Acaulospora colombiana TaxID=27376 RepID=A0ACA9JVF0_9GLOM|nr:10724_t:CDS:10 [Acaulospora colombiana]
MPIKTRNLVHFFLLFVISSIAFAFELDFDDQDSKFSDENISNLLNNKIKAIKASNDSLLWGTYRPNLYFGTRPRLPESLMTGLIWFGVNDYKSFSKTRHACDQSDELDEYSYKKHDGRSFAMQTITDMKNNVLLKTNFLKVPGGENESGGYPPPPFLFALDNEVGENSNFFFVQKMVETPFQFDIFFESDSSPTHIKDLTKSLAESSLDFDLKFERLFGLSARGFDKDQIYFAQTMMSNLIGGIGYFYGSSIVDRSYVEDVDEDEENFWDKKREPDPQLTPPASLFTATPSRPDEGFHQLLIGAWDNDLSLDITRYWTSLIDNDGWVAREQILGEEARSKVPEEFQTQYPHYANPPVLLMSISEFIERLDAAFNSNQFNIEVNPDQIMVGQLSSTNDPEALSSRHLYDVDLAKIYLADIYPKFRANYKWFRRTQWGEIKGWGRKASNNKEAYRWRGRTPGHTLTSGLDDYPRPKPHPAELHVDLMCWVGFMARSLADIAKRLDKEDDAEDFAKQYKNILANLDDLHWSEEHKAYCDLSVDENGISIIVSNVAWLFTEQFDEVRRNIGYDA